MNALTVACFVLQMKTTEKYINILLIFYQKYKLIIAVPISNL